MFLLINLRQNLALSLRIFRRTCLKEQEHIETAIPIVLIPMMNLRRLLPVNRALSRRIGVRTENVKTRLRKILQLQQDVYLLKTAIQKENVSAAVSLLRS